MRNILSFVCRLLSLWSAWPANSERGLSASLQSSPRLSIRRTLVLPLLILVTAGALWAFQPAGTLSAMNDPQPKTMPESEWAPADHLELAGDSTEYINDVDNGGSGLIHEAQTLTGTPTPTETITPTPVSRPIRFWLSPATGTYDVDEIFDVDIMVNTADVGSDSADVIIFYDPTILEVQDAIPQLEGIQITPGTFYPNVLLDRVDPEDPRDPERGRIVFRAVAFMGRCSSGIGLVGTIRFKALRPGIVEVPFDFTPGSTADTNAGQCGDATGQDRLGSVGNGEYIIIGTPSPTVTRTPTPIRTNTATPTATPTVTPTPTPTAAPSDTPTRTSTPTPTRTPTSTPSSTATSAPTWTATSTPTSTVTRGPFTQHYGMDLMPHGDIVDATSVQKVKDAGFDYFQHYVSWALIEPSRGSYHWDGLDLVLRLAEEHGLKPVFRIYQAPYWARSSPYGTAPPASNTHLADFVSALVSRYGTRVAGYVIWNEPNIPQGWGRQPVNAAAYVDMLRAAYVAAKRANPAVVIVSAGLAPTQGGEGAVSDIGFLQQMYATGLKGVTDVIGMNGLGFAYSPDDTSDPYGYNFSRLARLRQVMVDNGDADKRAWALEVGWVVDSPADLGDFNWWKVSEEQQAQYLRRAMEKAAQEWPWLEALFIWNLDFAYVPGAPDREAFAIGNRLAYQCVSRTAATPVCAFTPTPTPTATPGVPANLAVLPAGQEVASGSTATVSIQVENVSDLYGFEVYLTFDPTKLRVEGGIQGGDIFQGQATQVYRSTINNVAGTVDYAVSLQGTPNGMTGSGTFFSLTFRTDDEGTTCIAFGPDTALADSRARLIPTTTHESCITISMRGQITGRALLEACPVYSGTTITTDPLSLTALTDSAGHYRVTGVPAGGYTLSVDHSSHLFTRRTGVVVEAGRTTTLPEVTLLAGDVNSDGRIGIQDAVIVSRNFGQEVPPAQRVADLNCDARVNIQDAVLLSRNFDRNGPGPWSTPMSTGSLYAASPARLTVDPARRELDLGQTTTVDIKVEDVDDLYGFEVHLAFDPAKVQVEEPILMGNLFEGRVVQIFQNRVDNRAGTVDFAGALQAERQGISGDGTLFRLVLKGVGEGVSDLTFHPNTALADSQARLIPLETQGGVMNVIPARRLYLPLVTVQRQGG